MSRPASQPPFAPPPLSPPPLAPPHDGAEPAVNVTNLTVRFGTTDVLRGINFTVSPGEVVALLGANGSGKSTLVRALLDVAPIAEGSATIFGHPVSAHVPWDDVGYVPQRVTAGSGVPVSAREVVGSGLLTGRRLRLVRNSSELITAAMAAVGISDLAHRPVAELSGGQQQRVLIARALVRRPRLLVLDEPVAGVDLASQLALATTLETLRNRGATMIIVLHELGAFRRLIDRAIVLSHGAVIHDGSLTKLNGHDHDHVHPHEDPANPADWLAPELRLEP